LREEKEQGLLVMLDLKDSTKIAVRVGSEHWRSKVAELSPQVEAVAAKYGLVLQIVIWDALYLTRECRGQEGGLLEDVLAFARDAVALVDAWYRTSWSPHVPDILSGQRQRGRICISFGDVSRGMANGPTSNWTIVGGEMAAVSKMEDVCKKVDGVVFADASLESILGGRNWRETGHIVPNTQRMVFALKRSWQELVESEGPDDNAGREAA